MPGEPYKSKRMTDVNYDAFQARLDWPDIVVEGNCPRCEEDMLYRQRLIVIQGVMALTPEQAQRAYEDMRETAEENPREADLITVRCMCSGKHDGRPEDTEYGCGAFWGFHAEWGNSGVAVQLGPPRGAPDPKNAEEIQKAVEDELDLVRESAGNWRTALGALILAVLGFGTFGREEVGGLHSGAQIVLGILLTIVLLVSVYGMYRLARAAFGLPGLVDVTTRSMSVIKHEKSLQAAQDIRLGQILTGVSVGLIGVAILVLLFAPEADPDPSAFMEAMRGDQQVCGELMTDTNTLTLKVPVNEGTTENVPLDELESIEVVNGC